jgi:prevent-host-death family protein
MTAKRKTITELRNTLFETFDEVVSGEEQVITHKNGNMVAMVPIDKLEAMADEIELHKNLAIGYAQALRGEGITSAQIKKNLKNKEKALREKYGQVDA